MKNDWRVSVLLINCFCRMNPNAKLRFTEMLDNRILDKKIWEMIQEGKFPDWFKDYFSFDPLYGQLDGLRLALSVASRNLLLGLNGTNFRYYLLDLEGDELTEMASTIGLTNQEIQNLAMDLNQKLSVAVD